MSHRTRGIPSLIARGSRPRLHPDLRREWITVLVDEVIIAAAAGEVVQIAVAKEIIISQAAKQFIGLVIDAFEPVIAVRASQNVNARFNWRKALTLTIRVAETKQELLVAALNDPRWYQAALAGVRAQIHEARENEIAATITHDAWGDVETRARVKLKNIRGVDYAYVAHEGWIEMPAELAHAERKRFVGIWINALSDFSVDRSRRGALVASETTR